MRKAWTTVSVIALVIFVIGVFAVAVGFFMGSSPTVIENHGRITEYLERLTINRDILLRGLENLLAGWGLGF